ncbi:unnamed protein product [Blepharisma stoltei]|uniref:Uncharacterized protein n=1 Tax=Blepharisma stoltei TaxID=1481888 RepID=A0AAU9K2A1_9CILI|nr:unnamed protein product [Blepharisma stoltei]
MGLSSSSHTSEQKSKIKSWQNISHKRNYTESDAVYDKNDILSSFDSDFSMNSPRLQSKLLMMNLKYIRNRIISQKELSKICKWDYLFPKTIEAKVAATIFYWGEYTEKYVDGVLVEKNIYSFIINLIQDGDDAEKWWGVKALNQLSDIENLQEEIRKMISPENLIRILPSLSQDSRCEIGKILRILYFEGLIFYGTHLQPISRKILLNHINDFDILTQNCIKKYK